MFRKKIILLMAMTVLLSGCGVKDKITEKVKEKVNEEFNGSLKQAMELGVPMKCEWKQNEDKGTSYVKGKNVYVEMLVQGKTSYFIQRDNCMWIWGQEQPQGTKICSESTTEPVVPKTDDFKAKGVNLDVAYKCAPALIDDDKFNLPTNINFIDLQEMMKGLSIPAADSAE